ncbi:hypothetical protein FE257_004322 [Aspergillus nanangensis]|uniref:AAA+ ATPase domain-containing protein n=1 Tax=Aspergillus nanangensis TaxID=2582783 RepID=A0AAD4CAS0_ASPNN|nr:hypothetical protein FE257_004322 [Aspergillus nanangensis]
MRTRCSRKRAASYDEVIESDDSSNNSNIEEDKNGDTSNKKPKHYAPTGSICEVHNLYQTKPDENGRTSWTKKVPSNLTSPAENSESGQYALVVRNVKCYDGRRNLRLFSIVIQSDNLKQFLAGVFDGYPGLTMTLERVEFKPPFKPFVHRWEAFCTSREKVTDPTTRAHVDLLYRILEEELRDVISRKRDLILNGVITHDLLWTIFEPGQVVFAVRAGYERAFSFSSGEHHCQSGEFRVNARCVDWDGERFGFRPSNFAIPEFGGTLPIASLPVFPLGYHGQEEAVRKRLVERGALWEAHKGYHYKQYEGVSIGSFMGQEIKFNIKGRVIIDTEAFNTFNPDESVGVSSPLCKALDDDKRLLATPMVRGYSLKDKKWLEFYLDGVRDIVWDSRAFDSLVLPQGQQNLKQLILAFAKAQSKQLDVFDDVVQGKGRGIIMQLSGPPGVGKTLTAESVAEVMKVPLYVLSAGDLGTTASHVEDAMKDILRMVPKWGAVLLLDEADVFMEARNSTDLARNELVSIFLRLLEYYEGILFLTTNRADHIDPAFESRIHVSVRYPDLDTAARRQIWTQFLGTTPGFSSEQLESMAAVPLNGRQIKNVLKTAHLLAREQESELTYEHVGVVLNLRASNAPTNGVQNGVH